VVKTKVIIVGSGVNCREINSWNTEGYLIVVVNNAWKAVNRWNYLCYPGDFTDLPKGRGILVTGRHINTLVAKSGILRKSYHGTMFFTASYWALVALNPSEIGYIGMDMQYDKPNNAFYGDAKPDPLRFKDELNTWFDELQEDADLRNVQLINYSKKVSRLPFQRLPFRNGFKDMLIDSPGFGTQSFNEIIRDDFYDFRKYKEGEFKAILDIGANVGFFSIFARMRHPQTPVFAVEPCFETRKMLSYNCKHLNINLFSFALGVENLKFMKYPNSGSHQFRKDAAGYAVDAKSLPEIMELIKQNGEDVFIKVDCEGGERALLDNPESDKIIRRCTQLSGEIHFGKLFSNMPPYETWIEWLKKFKDTHEVSCKKLGEVVGSISLIKRKK